MDYKKIIIIIIFIIYIKVIQQKTIIVKISAYKIISVKENTKHKTAIIKILKQITIKAFIDFSTLNSYKTSKIKILNSAGQEVLILFQPLCLLNCILFYMLGLHNHTHLYNILSLLFLLYVSYITLLAFHLHL